MAAVPDWREAHNKKNDGEDRQGRDEFYIGLTDLITPSRIRQVAR